MTVNSWLKGTINPLADNAPDGMALTNSSQTGFGSTFVAPAQTGLDVAFAGVSAAAPADITVSAARGRASAPSATAGIAAPGFATMASTTISTTTSMGVTGGGSDGAIVALSDAAPGGASVTSHAIAFAPLTITPIFDATITGLGSGSKADPTTTAEVEAAINASINYYDNNWTSSVPIGNVINGTTVAGVDVTIDFSYGGDNTGGAASSFFDLTGVGNGSFGALKTALGTLLPNLPSTDPTKGGTILETNAQFDMLGLGVAGPTAAGTVYLNTIGNNTTLDYDLANQSVPGEIGAIGAIEHEISEIFGRVSFEGTKATSDYTLFDLYRFSSPGTPALTTGSADYFSVNGGTAALGYFNSITQFGGDAGDWASSGTNAVAADSYDAFSTTGTAGTISNLDSIVLSAIGFSQATTIGPRTMAWVGSSGASFASKTNWDDQTDALNPAQFVPASPDTASFLANGGAITGTGTAGVLEFGGAASWNLTAAASLTAASAIVVGQGGSGALLINAGAAIRGTGTLDTISGASGETAAVTVDGAGSAWRSGGALVVGGSGAGALSVSNGGSVSATATGTLAALALGAAAGGGGVMTVSGTGSAATLLGQLNVGQAGSGTLTVGAQGTVSTGNDPGLEPNEGLDVAVQSGASGLVTVGGSQALLANVGRFVVGDAGLGALSIAAGATVTTAPASGSVLPGAVVGNTSGANGSSVTVSGSGSNWRVTGLLDVGVAGAGALALSGGATVTAGTLDGGISAAAVANIGVTGIGTKLTVSGAATVADDGSGVLSVLNGATFSAASLTIGSQADSSGAVVVSGAGSLINLSGALNVGTALGIGDLTIGPGATVNAGVVNLNGDVVLEGGELDPSVNLINPGNTLSGSGVIANNVIVDEGLLLANGQKLSQRLLTITGTIVGGGTLTVNGTVTASGSPGIVQINASDTIDLTGPVLNSATTTFTDNQTPTGTYTVNNSVIDVVFADGTGVLLLDDIAGFGGTIATFKTGDQFVIGGGTLSNLGVTNGDTLTFSDSGTKAAQGGVDSLIFGSGVTASRFNIVNGNTVEAVACFAEGTRIETTAGMVNVEDLSVGDIVRTADGRQEPIVWLGRRTVDCACHPSPEAVWPVWVAAGALGRNVPVRDLYLSPDHAIFVDGLLVPVKLLVNGASIVQVERQRVTYHHVQLSRHEVIRAEGLTVESYLAMGNRMDFDGSETIRLFPDFAGRPNTGSAAAWEMAGAAPLVLAGPALMALRRASPARQPGDQ